MSYNIYRLNTASGLYELAGTDTAPPYVDTGRVGSTTYKVSQVDGQGRESALSAAVSATPITSTGPQLFMSPTGNDANDGSTTGLAVQTFTRASALSTPGVTINLASGTYAASSTFTASGTNTSRVTLKSTTKFGAVLPPRFTVTGSFVDVVDVDSTGTASTSVNVGLWGKGNFVRFIGCRVHDLLIPDSPNGGAGILLANDDYTNTGCEALGCLVFRIGVNGGGIRVQGIYWSVAGCTMKNNVVYDCDGWGIHGHHGARASYVTNNTVYRCLSGGIILSGGDAGVTAGGHQNTFVVNNVVRGCGGNGCAEGGVSNTNHWYNNNSSANAFNGPSGQTNSTDLVGNTTTDPLFVSATGVWGNTPDLHLQAGSPAANTGNSTTGQAWSYPPTDFDGAARPQGTGVDRGGYERA